MPRKRRNCWRADFIQPRVDRTRSLARRMLLVGWLAGWGFERLPAYVYSHPTAAVYISSVVRLPKDKKVYVIGESGIEHELREEGIQHLGGTVRPVSFTRCRTHCVNATATSRTLRTTPLRHSP